MAYTLTETEKHDAAQFFNEFDGDLLQIVQHVFSDMGEKGSSVKGRALRKYLAEEGLKYSPKKGHSNKTYTLSDQEKIFLKKNYNATMTKKEASRLLWPKETDKMSGFFRSEKYLALCKYIGEAFAGVDAGDMAEGKTYVPPQVVNTLVKLVNKVNKGNLDPNKLTTAHKKCIDRLSCYLNSPRFIQQINSYLSIDDRVLFESEYVKTTWDKPDLTADEINLYVNVCIDYINIKLVERQRQKLNRLFEEAEDSNDMHMRLTEMLKMRCDEYDKCTSRIDKLISKLNGDRKKRIEQRQQSNASVLVLVETFQEDNERKRMIAISELKAKKVEAEVNRLEGMDDWKARILGVGKEDVI
jgi:hypothetical protein